MKPSRFIMLAGIFLLMHAAAMAVAPDRNQVPPDVLEMLENAGSFELMALNPNRRLKPAPGDLHGWTVLGRMPVDSAATRAKLIRTLKKGADENQGLVAACFNPRHAIRVTHQGRTADLIICFECASVSVRIDGKPQKGFLTSGSPQVTFDQVLKEGIGTLKADESVILFPALASAVNDDEMEITVRGWIFEPERRGATLALLRKALGMTGVELTADEEKVFRERAHPFLYDNERGKHVMVDVSMSGGGKSGASGADGHFESTFRIPRVWDGRLTVTATPGIDRPPVSVEAYVLDESGISVISDIDDTIKLSEVTDRKALLRNTFLKPFAPVPGMADVYQSWIWQGASFHYVTASPWQLYPPLARFIEAEGFPGGTFHMKSFRVKDQNFFSLFTSPEQYKPGVIEPLLQRFPKRRFVLVGDAGEKDPEIYGALARKYPQQIVGIFIRDLQNGSDAPRYRDAFKEVSASRYHVFRDPNEVRDRLPMLSQSQ